MGDMAKRMMQKIANIFSGEYIFKLILKHIGFIICCFVLAILFITWGLFVESEMSKIRKNDSVIEELKIDYYQKDLKLIGLNKRSRIEKMLLESGNTTLHEPADPPKRIVLTKEQQ